MLGLRVCGSTADLRARHYDAGGFAPGCDVLLADDLVLRRRLVEARRCDEPVWPWDAEAQRDDAPHDR